MSYDFAILTPETAAADDQAALDAARAVFDQDGLTPVPDRRLSQFVADLEEAGAADEEAGWVSVWPIDVSEGGVAVPTTYADVESNLVTLLRLAAKRGLVLVDLNAESVHLPAPGQPIGVIAGDGTRLGALTRERLESLLAELPDENPYLVLERDQDRDLQTYRNGDGTFLLEQRIGGPDRHFRTTLTDLDEITDRMWNWLSDDPEWSLDLDWERMEL